MQLIRNIVFLSCFALLLAACQNVDTTSKDLDTILSDISDKYVVLSVGTDLKSMVLVLIKLTFVREMLNN